jgi:hypothetical protein
MATSRWQDVSLALITLMRAAPGYCAPAAAYTSGLIPVYDSVEVHAQAAGNVPAYLVVRWPGQPDEATEPGQAGQSLRTLGTNRARDERGEIRCRAVHQTGDLDVAGAVSASWAAAFAIVGDVEDLIRADPTLGVAAPRMLVQVGGLDRATQRTAGGTVTELDFTVTYDTRI